MTEDQFWRGPPALAAAYRKADELKQKRQNEAMWLQGMYFYDAFAVVMTNAFRKKGSSPVRYAEKPYDFFRKTKEETEALRRQEQEKARNYFENLRLSWQSKKNEKKQ